MDLWRSLFRRDPPFTIQRLRYPVHLDQTKEISKGESGETTQQRVEFHALCKSCKGVFNSSRLLRGSHLFVIKATERYTLHTSWADFEQAVQAGCHFCTIVAESADSHKDETLIGFPRGAVRIVLTSQQNKYRSSRTRSIWARVDAIDDGTHWWRRRMKVIVGHFSFEDTASYDPRSRTSFPLHQVEAAHGRRTSSEAHMKLARDWLGNCVAEHANCTHPRSDFLPTRLIEIMDGSDYIRLRTTTIDDQGLQYCALSHFWGGVTDILTLTSETSLRLENGIPLSDLPKTFRDAILVTKGLRLRHLWIDSLTIFQDSKLDWVRESSRMALVYENSTCTIVAAAARNPHRGCFADRNPLLSVPCLVSGTMADGLLVWSSLSEPFSPWVIDMTYLPLFKRAWVVQEQLLSPRTVIFADTTIHWSCRHGEGNERVGFEGLDMLENRLNLVPVLESLLSTEINLAEFHWAWFRIVERYTECELTNPGDKLVAIPAIAQRMKRASGFRYVAGMWEESLIYDLNWKLRNLSNQSTIRVSPYRAPTWSWASVDGKVRSFASNNYSEPVCMDMFRVISVRVSTHELDIDRTGSVSKYHIPSGDPLDMVFGPETYFRAQGFKNMFHLDTRLEHVPSTLYLLLICIQPYYGEQIARGLVLTCREDGRFERVGPFELAFSENKAFEGCEEREIEIV